MSFIDVVVNFFLFIYFICFFIFFVAKVDEKGRRKKSNDGGKLMYYFEFNLYSVEAGLVALRPHHFYDSTTIRWMRIFRNIYIYVCMYLWYIA